MNAAKAPKLVEGRQASVWGFGIYFPRLRGLTAADMQASPRQNTILNLQLA